MEKTKAEILLEKIKEHNNAYRAGIPIVSDAEYDQEVDLLKELDPDNEWFTKVEPAPVGEARKVKLPIPMKSLNKVKDMKSLTNWVNSLGLNDEDIIVITPKFDGLSLLHDEVTGMTYSRGGQENEGQNCTAHYNAANIGKKHTTLAFTYGEFVFNKQSWESNFAGKNSPYTGDKYKSPRNTAAGLLNRDQPCEELKYIDFFRYGTDNGSIQQFKTYVQLYTYLCRTFDQQFLYTVSRVKDITEEDLMSIFNKFSNEYYIDGLVLYVNDLNVWERVGRQETTGNPNYAIAYKNPNFTDTFTTTVRSVTWKIAKSGALKPVVNIDTVNTGDCEMENPTGYNAKCIANNNIGPGAVIRVTRSGGVIPKILEVVSPADMETMEDMWDELSICPNCGHPTSWNSSRVELCCTNENCCGRRLAKIVHFYNIVGVENMGEETISKMFNAGYNTLKRMLNITFEELMEIDSFGEAIANEILKNNKKIMNGVDIATLMQASDCFQGIGKVKATKILQSMDSTTRSMFCEGWYHPKKIEDMTETDLKSMSVTEKSFIEGVPLFYDFIAENRLKALPIEEQTATNSRYQGMTVCFTGIRDKELEDEIAKGGGKVCSSVSKKTTHLVTAGINSSSAKTEKAESLGIPILTIDKFKEFF